MGQSKAKILVVDDESANLQIMRHILQKDYQLIFAKDGRKALDLARDMLPDLILLDIMMPEMTGYEVLEILSQQSETRHIPVIFVTAMADVDNESYGLELGAVDYIAKPVNASLVRSRVRTHLSLVRVEELQETQLQIIRRLGHAAEYKDNETGFHVIRMSHYSQILGRAAGLDEVEVEQLFQAAPMHDIGKIGIPDSILLKPGKLDAEEWRVMKTHTDIGAQIIGDHKSPLLQMAAAIARTHHEKWSGSGYPRGLKGEDIPLAGRIVAITDVFDALTTARSYKSAWDVERAVNLITKESGQHFDPNLVPIFVDNLPEMLHIRAQWMES